MKLCYNSVRSQKVISDQSLFYSVGGWHIKRLQYCLEAICIFMTCHIKRIYQNVNPEIVINLISNLFNGVQHLRSLNFQIFTKDFAKRREIRA